MCETLGFCGKNCMIPANGSLWVIRGRGQQWSRIVCVQARRNAKSGAKIPRFCLDYNYSCLGKTADSRLYRLACHVVSTSSGLFFTRLDKNHSAAGQLGNLWLGYLVVGPDAVALVTEFVRNE